MTFGYSEKTPPPSGLFFVYLSPPVSPDGVPGVRCCAAVAEVRGPWLCRHRCGSASMSDLPSAGFLHAALDGEGRVGRNQ